MEVLGRSSLAWHPSKPTAAPPVLHSFTVRNTLGHSTTLPIEILDRRLLLTPTRMSTHGSYDEALLLNVP
jgi:hypothetical protein